MKVCINLCPALFQPTGVGVYARELFKYLSLLEDTGLSILGLSSSLKYALHIQHGEKGRIINMKIPSKLFNILMHRLHFPPVELLVGQKIDIVHSPYMLSLPAVKAKKIITVHDMYFMNEGGENISGNYQRDRKLFVRSIRNADAIICVSHFTRKRLIEAFPETADKAKVVHSGLQDPVVNNKNGTGQLLLKEQMRLPDIYILFIGTIERRKNIIPLLEAVQELNKGKYKVPLILVGKAGFGSNEVMKRIKELTCVKYFDYVTEEQKRLLYQYAKVLVMPSIEEGFGFPLLEAMSYGVPVIASRGSALEEIGENAVYYLKETTPQEIQDAIVTILKQDNLVREMVQKGYARIKDFNWENTAHATYEVYKEIMG
ncbi:MAG: hypothetical protein A2Y62_20615 [Candidatus Fischerbacteria bacterium RBG_13_37_8]|uniref:Glycosyl transferase family 1 n=1 Tax=Candidatus Fischerbacteria bacterium RBG_13_37_8 TaxID=1817863 RepID=A0A1F5VEG9_9BACT|nr:MAG: hypothetical protein A2Y62_20615 [Candidatus Fischerbacteria bacterium RBG_13_37_8]